MNRYCNMEKVDMLLVFGECRRNARNAVALYRERYPDRAHPSAKCFYNIERSLRLHGTFSCGKRVNRTRPVTNDNNAMLVLANFEVNPHTSTRAVAAEMDISHASVIRIAKKNKYHPFKMTLVQHLRLTDGPRRLQFIAWLIATCEEDHEVLNKIMWTDESKFTNNGIVNRHNHHFWTTVNPHWTHVHNFQNKISINVWCGILNGYLIGPYLYEENLTSDGYLHFLQYYLPQLIEDVPYNTRRSMYFQQDGCPAHNAVIVRNYLNTMYGDRLISTHGPCRWPARSPDLSPLDFYLWGYLKSVVYNEIAINSIDDLRERIIRACRSINVLV